MSSRRRPSIPLRPRIFLGCEGESEVSYGIMLQNLLEEQGKCVHIEAVPLALGAGNPLILANQAVRKMRERECYGLFKFRALLIDTDRLNDNPAHRQSVESLCLKAKIHVIWQDPCHEALLLRHFHGCAYRRPSTTPDAKAALEKQWPGYKKATPAKRLHNYIDADGLRQAASVEPLLKNFLGALGFA